VEFLAGGDVTPVAVLRTARKEQWQVIKARKDGKQIHVICITGKQLVEHIRGLAHQTFQRSDLPSIRHQGTWQIRRLSSLQLVLWEQD
jgi:hypothetical protein